MASGLDSVVCYTDGQQPSYAEQLQTVKADIQEDTGWTALLNNFLLVCPFAFWVSASCTRVGRPNMGSVIVGMVHFSNVGTRARHPNNHPEQEDMDGKSSDPPPQMPARQPLPGNKQPKSASPLFEGRLLFLCFFLTAPCELLFYMSRVDNPCNRSSQPWWAQS